jgi:2-methylcitrate dehydratase PrpD
MTKSPTLALADFASSIKYEDIPKDVRNKLKFLCLDAIGCALGSTKRAEISKIVNAIKELDNGDLGSIWGLGLRASMPSVALVNGTMVHFLEMDDVHKQSLMHPAAAIVPSAIAACEQIDTDGKDFIVSIVVGYEVAVRIGMAVGPISHRKRGWHATGSCGVFGAAVAAGKILNLNTEEMSWALGLAGIQPTGTWAFAEKGSMNKPFHAGRAAQGGIIAAFLAREGFVGPSNILEASDGGFFKAVSDKFDSSKITQQLGKKYDAFDSSPKIFPCCTYQHAPLYATLKILETNDITPEEIEKISVKTSEMARKTIATIREPKSAMEAQFSLPYGIAVAIFDKEVTLNQFSSERISDRQIIDLAKKVDVTADAVINRQFPEKFPSEVQIRLKNGRKYTQYVAGPPGEPENPVGDEVIENKFRKLSSSIVSSERIGKIIAFFRNLESQGNMAKLIEMIFNRNNESLS